MKLADEKISASICATNQRDQRVKQFPQINADEYNADNAEEKI
jgi:hypothetical protein